RAVAVSHLRNTPITGKSYTTSVDATFDHSGWHPEPQLLAVNTEFEGRPLERVKITVSLAEFCEEHHSRMPNQYWRDPLSRAREYVSRYIPPWA
ncbi:hypothetical protein ACPXCB_26270, partial [Micromonospora sp. DT62]